MAEDSKNESTEERLLISHLRFRRILGVLGVGLPFVLMFWGFALADGLQNSISDYYALRTRDAFVGTLVVIGLFLCAYRGYERRDDVAGYVACAFALGVAFFPNKPEGWQSTVHFSSAGGLFLVLSFFSLILFTKTKKDGASWWRRILSAFRFGRAKSGDAQTPQKRWRNRVYVACGLAMLVCMILNGLYFWLWEDTAVANIKPVFWLESLMIWAFGISWFVKGDWLWLLKDKNPSA